MSDVVARPQSYKLRSCGKEMCISVGDPQLYRVLFSKEFGKRFNITGRLKRSALHGLRAFGELQRVTQNPTLW